MKNILNLLVLLSINLALILTISAQTSEFSYQGFITDNNAPANGSYDIEFRLYAAVTGGGSVATVTRSGVAVSNGVFVVSLDFGDFAPVDRFLEIAVRPAGGGAFTTLSPRSKVLSVPVATLAKNAINANTLGGSTPSQFVLTTDTRLSDARNPLPGSGSYIQNRTTPAQPGASFNINGDGTVQGTLSGGVVIANTQYNMGLNRIIGKVGANNLFFGTLAGSANGGIQNTMLGDSTGRDNTGTENTMVGFVAGQQNTTGINNSFLGSRAGQSNLTGSNNTFLGYNSDGGPTNLTNSSAVGASAFVEGSDSMVLGSVTGKNGATTDVNVGIGTTTPGSTLDIAGQLPNAPPNIPNLRLTNYGRFSLIRGRNARGTRNIPAATGNGDPLFVITADGYTGNAFTALGQATVAFFATENWNQTSNGTSIKFNTTPNGSTSEALRMTIDQDGSVAIGAQSPSRKLDVDGIIRVGSVSGTIGCVEDRDGTVIAGTCSSDLRFKKNVTPFGSVLENFSKLRPVNYFWRADEFADHHFGTHQSFGLIAQDVEALFPELVSTDEKGFKAVNYSKLPLYTVQAVTELKAENDALKQRLNAQQAQIDELKKIVASIKEEK